MSAITPGRGGGPVWTVVEPPNWSREELLVFMELVPERPEPLSGGPPREMEEALGVELWRGVANVRTWAETRPAERHALFQRARGGDLVHQLRADAAAQAPELIPALDVFADLIEVPEHVEVRAVVSACRLVADWAENRGFSETALQFTEAAAAASPGSALLANHAARICRILGHRSRAELWYDRAIGLSRRIPGKRGARQYIHAQLGYATTLMEIEDHAGALEHIKRAGLTARRKGMKAKAAEAFHDAMYLYTVDNELGRAAVYARKAINIYPYHHIRYPALGHDFALLMVYRGMYPIALSILQSVVRKLPTRAEGVVVWGTLARSAAGTGRVARFLEAAKTVEGLATTFPHLGAAGLYSIAEGARLLGNWTLAEQYAENAVARARAHGSRQVESLADALLSEIESRIPGVPQLPRDDPAGSLLRKLAPSVRLRLALWRGPTWHPRRGGPTESDDDQ